MTADLILSLILLCSLLALPAIVLGVLYAESGTISSERRGAGR